MSNQTNEFDAQKSPNADYHIPIMLNECLDGLAIREDGIYVDLTFGGGGHSTAIASKLKSGKLYCFDQDHEAIENFQKIIDKNPALVDKMVIINANFRFFKKYLRLHKVTHVDGVIADFGVSSHQFDEAGRGFSYRFDADLDMRMNQSQSITAKEIIQNYDEKALTYIFKNYGEIDNAWKLANTIIRERAKAEIKTTAELCKVCFPLAKKGSDWKYFSQVFQALRIEVNEELKAIEEMLPQTIEVIKKGGRLAIITFHSLEDRLVKNFIKQGKLEGEAEKNIFGHTDLPFEALTRKPIEPTEQELMLNSRARSAKLRVAERR